MLLYTFPFPFFTLKTILQVCFVSPERDSSFMGGWLEPGLAVGAAQVCEGTPLLEPPVHAHLDVTVCIPVRR